MMTTVIFLLKLVVEYETLIENDFFLNNPAVLLWILYNYISEFSIMWVPILTIPILVYVYFNKNKTYTLYKLWRDIENWQEVK